MPPSSLNRREYGKFKQMLEQALSEITLPSGIVDTDNIIPGAIRPENCNLDAEWNFSSRPAGPRSRQTEMPQVSTENKEVIFLDAPSRQSVYTLPPASKYPDRMFYIKRVDQDSSRMCRVETISDDKIDNEERIILSILEAVILIANSGKWHILSRYTPPKDVQQNLNLTNSSNVDIKTTLLTTD